MVLPNEDVKPSKLWYVGYAFFGSILGLICYYMWRNKNNEKAVKHLVDSVWISIILTVGVFIALIIIVIVGIIAEFLS